MKSASDARAVKEGDPIARRSADGPKLAKARAAAALVHPHLVPMTAKEGEGPPFVPELHGGMRLSELCRKRFASGPVPLGYGLRILLDTLSGLAALHGSLSFSHSEVSPRNIVVGRDGTSRLIPVVATHWEEDAAPDSEAAGYAAPERLRGDPIDHRADIFSAGVMLWEMITGRSFRGLPAATIAAWVVDGKVPDPVHPDDAPWVVDLAAVATRALAVNPAERWQHVGVMGAEIETVAEGHMASTSEVADLVNGGGEIKGRTAPSQAPPAPSASQAGPSLAPIAVSIAPPAAVPPAPLVPAMGGAPAGSAIHVQDASPAPPVLYEPSAPSRRAPKRKGRQSLIAWSTLSFALVLLVFAAHELFDAARGSKAAPAAATGQSFVVRLPTSVPVGDVPSTVSAVRTTPPAAAANTTAAPPAPSVTSLPAPPSAASWVAPSMPPALPSSSISSSNARASVPATPPAPIRRTTTPAAPRKSKPRENPFGI